MGDQEGENGNCPCKRQRLRQGTKASEEEEMCRFRELRSFLFASQEPDTSLSTPPLSAAACSREPDYGGGTQSKEQLQGKSQGTAANNPNESNMAARTLNMELDEHVSGSFMPVCDNTNNNEGGNMNNNEGCDTNYTSSIKMLSFGEYDLETGQMIEHPMAGKAFHPTRHLLEPDEHSSSADTGRKEIPLNLDLQTCAGSQTEQRRNTENSEKKIQALAENSLIGSIEKSKFTGNEKKFRESGRQLASDCKENERQQTDHQQESNESLMTDSLDRVMPPEYLTDTGFIDLFSSDHVIAVSEPSTNSFSSQISSGTQNLNNNNQRKSGKPVFRINPQHLTQNSTKKKSETFHGSIIAPSSFTKRKTNELFDIDTSVFKDSANSCAINSLPCSLILEIFKYLMPCCLLRKVSCVCKYWYNLSRDPALWRTLNLRNQHKLRDEILEQLMSFSERVLHVNLTDCRFITDRGVKAVLSRCRYIQTLKLMRCFDLTDHVFEGLGLRKFCRELTALHLDGCYKISDKTIMEVAEACQNLQVFHLNQCNKVTDAGVTALAQNCPKLKQLLLDHCDKVTDKGAVALVQGCPNLVYLNFMSCGVSDIGVKEFAKLKNLANIDLSNIPRLTPRPVMEIARSCPRLECINISLNSVMDDECVTYIAKYCQQLKRLYCVSCNVTDKGLEEIAKYCPTLEALDVGWCQDISDHGVRVISLACKQLGYFGLIRCDRVTLETVEELVLKYPQINYSTFILESRRLLERARREGFHYESEDALSVG